MRRGADNKKNNENTRGYRGSKLKAEYTIEALQKSRLPPSKCHCQLLD